MCPPEKLPLAPVLSRDLFEKLFPAIAYAQKPHLFNATVSLVRKPASITVPCGMAAHRFVPTPRSVKKAAKNHDIAGAAFRVELNSIELSDQQREKLFQAADLWQKHSGLHYLFLGLSESAS